MKQQKGKIQVLATKVTIETKMKLARVAQAFGLSFYELFQAFVLLCLRLSDAPSSLSDEHRAMVHHFWKILMDYRESFNPIGIKDRNRHEVKGALLFIKTPSAMRPQLLAVSTDASGQWREHYNHDTMLSDFLNATDPQLLRQLREEAKQRKQATLLDTMREVIADSQQSEDRMQAEIEELFSDIRTSTGEKIQTDTFYKGKFNKGDYTTLTPHKKRLYAEMR